MRMQRLVLIVDDSASCAETLQIALEAIPGVAVEVSPNAQAAIASLRHNHANLAAVVTDLHMPQHDGFELIERLRAEPRFASLPILLISGDSDPHLPERALARGASAFFTKPYSPAEVRRKLEQLICAS
jgi:CheY-like chemotaxis protein